jgi:hypothetical protein
MPRASSPDPRASELLIESTRLARRYIDEVVLELGLCPWAKGALNLGRVQIFPLLGDLQGPQGKELAARELLDTLMVLPREIELILAPFPEFSGTRTGFDEVARELRRIDLGREFALAAFHPDPVTDVSDASKAVSLFRRSPDPMLQVVRTEVLDRLSADSGEGTSFVGIESLLHVLTRPPSTSVRQRVINHNFEVLESMGRRKVEMKLEDIHEDRLRTYARIRAQFAGGQDS